jgi:hypothetical protein
MARGGAARLALIMLSTLVLSACGSLARIGEQLDSLLVNATGVGSGSSHNFSLPHGKYTVFSWDDPAGCVQSLALVNSIGHEVGSDASFRSAARPPGAVADQSIPSFVQQELQADTYHLALRTGAPCAWMAQVILNSLLDLLGARPDPVKPPVATSEPVNLGQAHADRQFEAREPGLYHVQWKVEFPASDPACSYDLTLVAADGHREHLADSSQRVGNTGAGAVGSDGPMFLAGTTWHLASSATCPWNVTISPWVGSLGGGVQGFAPT